MCIVLITTTTGGFAMVPWYSISVVSALHSGSNKVNIITTTITIVTKISIHSWISFSWISRAHVLSGGGAYFMIKLEQFKVRQIHLWHGTSLNKPNVPMFHLKFTHLEYNSVDMGKALESLWKRLRSLTSLFGWISLLGIWQPWRTSLFHLCRGHPCGMIVSMWASREPLASSVCGRALERCRGCWVLRRVPSPAKVALGQTLGEHLQVLLQVHLQVLLQHTKCSTTGQWWMSVLMEVSSYFKIW